MEVATSLLDVDENNSIKTFYRIETAHTDYFHIDVMDGEFVKNNTIEKMTEYADNLKNITNIPLDVHLMVKNVKKYVDQFSACQPRSISFHIEAIESAAPVDKEQNISTTKSPVANVDDSQNSTKTDVTCESIINEIKHQGAKAGIAINPETPIEVIYKYLPKIHYVLIMSVHPGKGGQQFIPETIDKIKALKAYIEANNLDTEIEVDGGVNTENISAISEAGADIVVAGNAIVNSKDYVYAIKKLKLLV